MAKQQANELEVEQRDDDDIAIRIIAAIANAAEDGIILTYTLGALAYTSTLAVPFGLSWALSYMLVRTLFDTLRRRGGRWAVLLGVTVVAIVLTLVHARDYGREAREAEALAAWRNADAQATLACAGARAGSSECVQAVEAERAAALRLCDVSAGRVCP